MYESMIRARPKFNKSTLQRTLLNLTLYLHIYISFYIMGSPGFLQLYYYFNSIGYHFYQLRSH